MPTPEPDARASAVERFRKKPVVIEAMRYTAETCEALCRWMGYEHPEHLRAECGGPFMVETLEGPLAAQSGDWIIRGVKGEFYPCKPDIFAMTYEPESALLASSGWDGAAMLERCAEIAESYLHVERRDPASDHDGLDLTARYSNGTVRRIAAAIRALPEAAGADARGITNRHEPDLNARLRWIMDYLRREAASLRAALAAKDAEVERLRVAVYEERKRLVIVEKVNADVVADNEAYEGRLKAMRDDRDAARAAAIEECAREAERMGVRYGNAALNPDSDAMELIYMGQADACAATAAALRALAAQEPKP